MRTRCSFIFLVCLCMYSSGHAEELITSFHSDIEIMQNGDVIVTEHITVNAEGNRIKRGIYRDFPTKYRDHFNNRYNVGFWLEALLRNGEPEAWHQKTLKNGIRTYFGRKQHLLKQGEHKYEFSYRTNRQIGFFDRHDELYWNVTGNDWEFVIEKASARVRLPGNITADSIDIEAYTGKQFDKGRHYYAEVRGDSLAFFETTRPLPRKHGLTIVVGFPKGHVIEPSTEQKLRWFLADNRQILFLIGGILILLLYYWITWIKVGRDPETGVIVTQYTPPKGYSPASMRFIENMRYDDTCFTAALVNLAVKGYLSIEQHDDEYTLKKQPDNQARLAPGEAELVKKLFRDGRSIEMKQSNHDRFRAARSAHKASLKKDYEKLYFFTNTGYHTLGAAISLLVLIGSLFADTGGLKPEVLFVLVWLTCWTIGVFVLLKTAWLQWQRVKDGLFNVVHAVIISAFAIPFLSAELFVLKFLADETSYTLMFMVLLVVTINWLFYELLKAPTRVGRELLDKVEGFRHYIDVAERNELEMKYAPKKTPEQFEQYLPYAIALGMETQWANIFSGALADLQQTGDHYQPAWYRGSNWNPHRLGEFTSGMSSSLTSAVTSSSTAPGSSSGGGGGGFSGGGGGGGGGGGW